MSFRDLLGDRRKARLKSRLWRYKSDLCLATLLHGFPTKGPRRLSAAESMGDLGSSGSGSRRSHRHSPLSTGDTESPLFTPPGTPPPPYGGSTADLTSTGIGDTEMSVGEVCGSSPTLLPRINQPYIMSIEDDDLSEQESGQEDQGAFSSLSCLLQDPAHLAVFINYVISNCDPASLFFYLISDLYKEGNAKDMRRWAYEIHSSFLMPGAAMRVPGVDDAIVSRIDEILANDLDKEEKLRTLFQRARARAREEIGDQLADFRGKRAAGLGAIFGPRDSELEEARHDKLRETRIVEEVLVKLLETVYQSSEAENATEHCHTQASSLTTVLYKHFSCRHSAVQHIADNCPMFVSKERSLRSKLLNRYRKPPSTRGHQFQPHVYNIVTSCNVCGDTIRGISPQGYMCAHCEMNIHKQCLRTVEEQCVGANPKRSDKISKLMERIMPEQKKKTSGSAASNSFNMGQSDRGRRAWELEPGDTSPASEDTASAAAAAGDRVVPAGGAKADPRRPDVVSERDEQPDSGTEGTDTTVPASGLSQLGKKSSAITRSESYRDHRDRQAARRQIREKRKHSDPNIPASKVNDVELDNEALYNNNHSGSSSNSSLSARLESPSSSLDIVSGRVVSTLTEGAPGWDSDVEVDQDPVDWKQNVDPELLKHLKPKEKQRLDVVNELFHTERTHVRNLKVLVYVFYRPMVAHNILSTSDINLLFGNLEELLEIHSGFNAAMKKRQRENPIVENVGDILVTMFDGESGENFKTAAAAFCRCQSIALEKLRSLQKRDARLAAFLSEAESDPACRRLQLKDLLPTAMQRLTKYPLLLANLAKYTARGTEEHRLIQASCDRSKAILEHVNKVKGETERHERLVEIQSKLEQNGFTRNDSPIVAEFNGRLDLTKYRMVHEGPVQWKVSSTKGKHVELHMILLEQFIVLLQKQDDKYVLKFHTVTGREMSPIIRNENILVRPVATEKRAFFILHNLNVGPQIYELLFSSSSERETWYRLIKDAADAYQSRDGKGHKRAESAHTLLQPQDSNDSTVSAAAAAGASSGGELGEAAPAEQEEPSAAASVTAGSSSDLSPAPSPGLQRHQLGTGSLAGAGAEGGASPGERRRMQRVEMLKIAESTPLIEPTEVVVSQGVVLSAEPVLTPIERLRRQDEQVRRALAEKEQLVADVLQIPRQDFQHIAEMAAEPGGDKDARELILNAILSVDRSMCIINDTLRVSEADIVSSTSGQSAASPRLARRAGEHSQLLAVHSRLSSTLTTLLAVMTERDEERERLRRELRLSHERIHQLHRDTCVSPAAAAPPATSDPMPVLRVEDEVPEETNQQRPSLAEGPADQPCPAGRQVDNDQPSSAGPAEQQVDTGTAGQLSSADQQVDTDQPCSAGRQMDTDQSSPADQQVDTGPADQPCSAAGQQRPASPSPSPHPPNT